MILSVESKTVRRPRPDLYPTFIGEALSYYFFYVHPISLSVESMTYHTLYLERLWGTLGESQLQLGATE